MEYVYYVLFILAMMAACLYMMGLPRNYRLSASQVDLADKARKRRSRDKKHLAKIEARRDREFQRRIVMRDLSNVPVPWGWPGNKSGLVDFESGEGMSASLHRWVDHLVREKRTVEDQEFAMKKAASLRALLEDRYGRASNMPQMHYHKVKAPLLRDPGAPHDQMDNFPSGQTARITNRLSRQPVSAGAVTNGPGLRKVSGLQNLRTPWGW